MISRRTGTSIFPADCTLVAAMNPCPCGYLGHPEKACRCSAASVARYRARVSGPLLDRIDALIEVPPLTLAALDRTAGSEPSAVVRKRVVAARVFRAERLQRSPRLSGTLKIRSSDGGSLAATVTGVSDGLSGRGYVQGINWPDHSRS